MVDQTEGVTQMTVKVPMDNMRRITVREQDYYYHNMPNTPFSLGIALPSQYGKYQVKGGILIGQPDTVDGWS